MHMQFLTYDCIGLTDLEVSSEKWLSSEHSVSNKAFNIFISITIEKVL